MDGSQGYQEVLVSPAQIKLTVGNYTPSSSVHLPTSKPPSTLLS